MQNLTRQILTTFDDHFSAYDIAVAEQMASRFIAGDDIRYIATDFGMPEAAVIIAIRFFYLKTRGNKTVAKVYEAYRRRKFNGDANIK